MPRKPTGKPPGRPALEPDAVRALHLDVRWSPAELERIEQAAARAEQPPGTYVREVALQAARRALRKPKRAAPEPQPEATPPTRDRARTLALRKKRPT